MRSYCRTKLLLSLALMLLPAVLAGCQAAGAILHAIPPANISAAYTGMQGQAACVMVWAERPIRIDWENMQLDMTTLIQTKLQRLQKAEQKELEGMTWPYQPTSVARWQRDHLEVEGQSVIDFAPRLGGITRLIYVEIQEFQTRSDASLELYKGKMSASMKIVEINNGKARVAFEENDLRCTFPPKIPSEGVMGLNDYQVYLGSLDTMSTLIVNRLVEHAPEEN